MDDLVKDLIPLLQYLIPGFLSAWIFYSLTAFKRPDTFGQIVQALIFTLVIHGTVLGIGGICLWVGKRGISVGLWDIKAEAFWAFCIATMLGLMSCRLATNDRLHRWLRSRNVTTQTSYPSEWFNAFAQFDRLITLHLDDERRLFGWPAEWPAESSSGQFLMHNPIWLKDDGTLLSSGAEYLLIDSAKVKWVEFNPITEGST
ncbi:hypothetical protein GIW70_02930 [Pseudomonas syringae]|nr:hypothetical protein [Pseudomonas syringae]